MLLRNYRQHWDKKLAGAIEPLSNDDLQKIIESFYSLLRLPPPHIVLVDSPMQLMLIPALLRIRSLADPQTWAFIEERLTLPVWKKAVATLNERITDEDIQTLLFKRRQLNSGQEKSGEEAHLQKGLSGLGGLSGLSGPLSSYTVSSVFGRPMGESIDTRLGFFESIVSQLESELDSAVSPEVGKWICSDTCFADGGMPGRIVDLHNIDWQAETVRNRQLRTAVQNLSNMGTTERAALSIFRQRGDATSLVRDEMVKQGELEGQFLEQLGEETANILAHALSAKNLEPTIYESYMPALAAIEDTGSSGLWFTGQLAVGFNNIVWQPKLERLANFTFLIDAGLSHFYDETTIATIENLRIFLANRAPLCPFSEIAFVSKPPRIFSLDEDGRLHSVTGPALQYDDGYSVYAVNGVVVQEKTALAPATLTVEEIDGEINLEVRRLMMERFGIARYLLESKADIINEDQYGTLYRKRMTGDEPLVMVRVKNSTPEPDGGFREYFLRVPPFMRTAKEAVAWTFNIEEEQYHPEQET